MLLFLCWVSWMALVLYVAVWMWSPPVAVVVTGGLLVALWRYGKHRRAVYKRQFARAQAAREAQWAERAEYYRQERAERADRLWEQHADDWERELT